MKETLYIVSTSKYNEPEAEYVLFTEDGEALYGHYCSNDGYAWNDLVFGRPERIEQLNKRFGVDNWEVKYLKNTDISQDEMFERNKQWAIKNGLLLINKDK